MITVGKYEDLKIERLGYTLINNQGLEISCTDYNNAHNITVEFKEPYYKVKSNWSNFIRGKIKNPYYPSVYGVGIIGEKYPIYENDKKIKEYNTWCSMLERCYSEKYKNKYRAYKNVTCCEEWLLFDNFYEWLHSQENFDKWLNSDYFAIDKDILKKGNKIYSPETCCLVPINVNTLFTKLNYKGNMLVGIGKNGNGFQARLKNPLTNKREYLGTYPTQEQAFEVFKHRKEDIIKQVAKNEYLNNNITKQCYEAMMNYKVELDD